MNRLVVAWGILTALAGGFIGLVGFVVFLNRVRLAVTLLGANIMFGMPWAQPDAEKVTLIALAGLGTMALGGFTFAAGVVMGLVQFARGK